ncbi:MAG TPA: hypothetical protein VHM26_14780 [Chitinophagaceae bacterium]|jgi:hypothetical protein|nr:hypothetical protein [Chitinophagaceae bacterium]
MKHIIILKGERNTGKTRVLKYHIQALIDMPVSKRILFYRGRRMLVMVRPLHESADWREVLAKIDSYQCDIVLLASWNDDMVSYSKYVQQTTGELISEHCSDNLTVHSFCLQKHKHKFDIAEHHCGIANQIKDWIDEIIDRTPAHHRTVNQ